VSNEEVLVKFGPPEITLLLFLLLILSFGQDLNKVAMGIYRPCSGIFVRLSQRVVQENSQLMGSFTSQRPIRRSADLARPI